jgi:hypothetical protein
MQDDPEPLGPPPRIKLPVEHRQRLELLLRWSLLDVDAHRLPVFERRVLLHEIVGDRVEVVDWIANPLLVADPQHPYVHLLRQVRCIDFAADAPPEEALQAPPVLGKQPLDQGWFRVSHGDRDA